MASKNFKGTVAYGIAPHEGGTTTVYLNLGEGLRTRGWRFFGVTVGEHGARLYDPRFGDEATVVLAPKESSLIKQVEAFLAWVEKEKVDIVIPNCEDVIYAALPHLLPRVRRVNICHTITRSAYLGCAVYRNRLDAVVILNERQKRDLAGRWAIPEKKLHLIPHGVDTTRYLPTERKSQKLTELHLIYLGRLDDLDKGIMFLPSIFLQLRAAAVPFSCAIVGSGPDSPKLEAALARKKLLSQVKLIGQVVQSEVPGILSQAEIFLMPSRFEGFGLSLIEAMAAGCVPIASNLSGVTDMIIEDGVSGFLCPVGDIKAFADRVVLLHHDRERLAHMSQAARRRVEELYSLEKMCDAYDRLFTEILASPPPLWTPKPLSQFQYPKELLPTWRTRIPLPLKNFARTILCRYFNRVDI